MNNSNLVDVEFLAQFFDKDARTIQLWAKFEGMPKEDRGLYDFMKCVKWRCEYLEEKLNIAETSKDEKLHRLKVEGQKLANKRKAIELKQLIGELVPYDTIKLAWINETIMFRRNLQSAEYKISNQLDFLDRETRQRVEQIVKKEIYETQRMIGELKVDLQELEKFYNEEFDNVEQNITEEENEPADNE